MYLKIRKCCAFKWFQEEEKEEAMAKQHCTVYFIKYKIFIISFLQKKL